MGLGDAFQRGRSDDRDARDSGAVAARTTDEKTRRDADASGGRDRGVSPREARRDAGVRAARERFGGLDIPATLVGMLTALAVLILLGGLISAAVGAIGYQTGLKGDELGDISLASLIGGLITLFVAFAIGGWAAGRMARYDGARNGLMTALWTILLAAILSALAAWLGSEYDILRQADLPQWFSQDALTAGGIVSALVAIAVMLLAGLLGGLWGERYHRRADAAIVGTRRPAVQ